MPNYKRIAYRHLTKCLSCPIMALYLLTQLDRKISVSLILLSFWKGTPCSLVTSTRFSSAAGGLWLQRWRFFWAILTFTWVGASVMVPSVSRTIEITHLNKSGSCWLFFYLFNHSADISWAPTVCQEWRCRAEEDHLLPWDVTGGAYFKPSCFPRLK